MRRQVRFAAASSLLLALGGMLVPSCGSDDWSLLAAGDPDDPRVRDLRDRLNIRVLADGEDPLPEACRETYFDTVGYCTPQELTTIIVEGECYSAGAEWNVSTCGSPAILADQYICAAETLLRVANAVASEVVNTDGDTTNMLVPPQDPESRAELGRIAMREARLAALTALDGLLDVTCTSTIMDDAAGSSGPAAEITQGAHLALLAREAYHLLLEAADQSVAASVAVSDAQRAHQATLSDAEIHRAAAFASRVSAAHMLVGGAHGLTPFRGDTQQMGLFPQGRLSDEAQLALQYFRLSGIDPAVLGDGGVGIDDILYDDTFLFESLAGRLAMMLPDEALITAGTSGGADGVLRRLGISRAAFVEAREYLGHEYAAFDRSPVQLVAPEPLPSGESTNSFHRNGGEAIYGFSLFASTRNPPEQPLPLWWSATIRYQPSWVLPDTGDQGFERPWEWGHAAGSESMVPDGATYGSATSAEYGTYVQPDEANYGGFTLATDLEDVADTAHRAAGRIATLVVDDDDPPADALDIVGRLLSDIGQAPPTDDAAATPIGRARVCIHGNSGDASQPSLIVDVELPGVAAEDLIAVNTHDALDCAVRGRIEGVPCTADDLAPGVADFDWITGPTGMGHSAPVGTEYVRGELAVTASTWGIQSYRYSSRDSRPIHDTYSLFVLRLRDGATPGPGAYEAVTGWLVPRPTDLTDEDWWIGCQSTPIIPGLDSRVVDTVGLSTEFPGDPAVSCAGVPSDLRLPLENELTDDFNGIEDSWRHYLTLAQSAADQADMLGDTLVEEGLQMDLRAETATDELQEICGVSLNFSPFATFPATTPLVMGECEAPYSLRRPTDTVCTLDIVRAAAAFAGNATVAAQLTTCLGELSETPTYTALGDHDLCLWTLGGTVCGADMDHPQLPCPYLADPDGSCTTSAEDHPAAATVIGPVTQRLGLFAIPEDPLPPPPSAEDFPCGELATLRAHGTTTASASAFATLAGSAFFSHAQFREAARQLRWEASAGDRSRVLFGNSVVFSTRDDAPHWPMAAAPADDVAPLCGGSACFSSLTSYAGPLFSIPAMNDVASGNDSDHRALRARLNDLLARAVIAAHLLGGAPLAGSRVPYAHWQVHGQGFDRGHFAEVGSTGLYQSEDGYLFVDDRDGDPDPGSETPIHDMHLLAQVASASGVPEWTVCPYDSSADCGPTVNADNDVLTSGVVTGTDGYPFNLPFFAYTLPDSVDEGNVDAPTASLWGEGSHRSRATSYFNRLIHDVWIGGTPSATARSEFPTPDGTVSVWNLTHYFESSRIGNPLFIEAGDFGISDRDMLNGMELTCLAARMQSPHPDPIAGGCNEVRTFTTVGDVLRSSDYLNCVALHASDAAGRSVIAGLPDSVIQAVTHGGPTIGGTGAGEYMAQVSEIQAALIQLRDEQDGIADDVRRYADQVAIARNQVEAQALASEIEDLHLESTVANAITSCVVSIAHIGEASASGGFGGGFSGASAGVGAAATCANGVFQTVIAGQIRGLQGQEGQLEIENALSTADIQFVSSAGSIRAHAVAIQAAIARIEGALTQLRTLQARGRTALARAMFLDDTSTGRHFAVESVMHRRYNTTLMRYRDAFQRAQRLAYIARLALEQRLAVHLSDMHEDLISVNAPARWADELCTLSPLNYETLRMSSTDASLQAPDNYAGYYLGDYVRRLDQVFESYPFAYPFHEGTDTVVLSLRDDVFRTRRECAEPVPNLLFNAGALDARATATRQGWSELGCATTPGPDASYYCTSVARNEEVARPMATFGDALGGPAATTVTFGLQATSETRLSQSVALEAGRYRVSWFAYTPDGLDEDNEIDPMAAVRALDADGSAFAILDSEAKPQVRTAISPWARFDYFFDVHVAQTVEIAVLPSATTVHGAAVVVSGLQLVRAGALFSGDVNGTLSGSMLPLAQRFDAGLFYNTNDSRSQLVPDCADDGTEFRRRAFTQACVPVCPDGYDGTCDPAVATQRCAWQTSFNVSSDSFERLLTGRPPGFASGNYNYRFESLGVNLVGTNLRDCGDGGSSGCYASGNFSFSVVHQGPFFVRNAGGGIYSAPLFPGRIESARALAAERYISNPISSADDALLRSYVRTEFAGRPLGGGVVLRIWDDDTLAFNRLEDVQVVLSYRYWQHQR